MKSTLEEKMKYLKQEAEADMFYHRDRMYENTDGSDTNYYERRYAESKAYFMGVMDILNTIVKEQVK